MAWPISEATSVLGLVASGDLSRDMSLHMERTLLKGDFRELGTSVKTVVARLRMVSSNPRRNPRTQERHQRDVDQLRSFSAEMIAQRAARFSG
jgi:hypothetical protein